MAWEGKLTCHSTSRRNTDEKHPEAERDVDVAKALYGTKRKFRIGILGAFSLLRIQE